MLKLIENLIQSTTPPGSHGADLFWQKSETALLQALVLYLKHEAPKDEQNFPMVMEMLEAAQAPEGDEGGGMPESPLDILFARLEMKDPSHIAVRQYKIFKMGAGKTIRSILISTAVQLGAVPALPIRTRDFGKTLRDSPGNVPWAEPSTFQNLRRCTKGHFPKELCVQCS